MFGSAKKVPTSCPHCGSVQLEPRELISTYCRSCGDHFTVAPTAAIFVPASPARAVRRAFTSRLREQLHLSARRLVTCHECGHRHGVPGHTSATQCPACGTAIDFQNVEITGHSTRVVRTHGTVHVGRDGFLNSTRVDCGDAFVEGRIAGKITCEGTLRLRGEGLCRAQIRTHRLFIDRGANLRFASTIYADEILIRGIVLADVQCGGPIHIGRSGALEGDVQSRAMTVEKGGRYVGDVEISAGAAQPALLPPEKSEVRVAPAWHPLLAFG